MSKCLFVDFLLCTSSETLPYFSLQASALIYLPALSKAILRRAFSSLSFGFAQEPTEHPSSPSAALQPGGMCLRLGDTPNEQMRARWHRDKPKQLSKWSQ